MPKIVPPNRPGSNARSEGLAERGKFISVDGIFREWRRLVKKCFDDSLQQEDSVAL